jgi:hypothetical protein
VRFLRTLAWVYVGTFFCSLALAVVVDISLRNDPSEHMMPNLILAFVTSPLSFAVFRGLEYLPAEMTKALEWGRLPLFVVCGCLQAAFLFWLSTPKEYRSAPPNNPLDRSRPR